ncbi:MAG: hypothetical protein ACKVIN_11725 [Longimicrobiales bacterium]
MSDETDKATVMIAGRPAGGATPGRRFGDEEIERILQSAAELQLGAASVELDASRGLTLEELRQVAEEAGIDPRFIDLAAKDVDGPVERHGSGLAGGAYRWHFRTSVPGTLGDGDRERLLRAIRSVLGQKGEIVDVFGRMEWSHDDGAGPIIIGISSREGQTEIDVSAVKSTEAGMIHALGIPFGGALGGAAVAGMLGLSGGAAIPAILVAGGASWGAARIGWKARSFWWERRLRKVIERVSSIVQDVALLAPPDDGA